MKKEEIIKVCNDILTFYSSRMLEDITKYSLYIKSKKSFWGNMKSYLVMEENNKKLFRIKINSRPLNYIIEDFKDKFYDFFTMKYSYEKKYSSKLQDEIVDLEKRYVTLYNECLNQYQDKFEEYRITVNIKPSWSINTRNFFDYRIELKEGYCFGIYCEAVKEGKSVQILFNKDYIEYDNYEYPKMLWYFENLINMKDEENISGIDEHAAVALFEDELEQWLRDLKGGEIILDET